MKLKSKKSPSVEERASLLIARRNLKMARSAHAYVRGSTVQFYRWLETDSGRAIPSGPAIWICGDCHIGNLGPLANNDGQIDVQIRDFDQSVIGNPAHDLIRLSLSLASAARGSDLPGVITARMLERVIEGYERAFVSGGAKAAEPPIIQKVLRRSTKRTWKHLAKERIENTAPFIPFGKRFWHLSKEEMQAVRQLFEKDHVRRLVTALRQRNSDASITVVDAAYWVKGCSSLGNLRIAVLVQVEDEKDGLCLIDIKEAVKPAAPQGEKSSMPKDQGERVVQAARHLSPYLGDRMLAEHLLDRSVVLRELMPQDLQLNLDQLSSDEATDTAGYLAFVVGKAHAGQMNAATKKKWLETLRQHRSKTLDAPSWLWSSIVDLITSHEAAYLEHCRKYALQGA